MHRRSPDRWVCPDCRSPGGSGRHRQAYFIEKRTLDVFLVALPKVCIVIGGVYMVVTYKFQLTDGLTGPLFILIVPAVGLVFGKMVLHLGSFLQ